MNATLANHLELATLVSMHIVPRGSLVAAAGSEARADLLLRAVETGDVDSVARADEAAKVSAAVRGDFHFLIFTGRTEDGRDVWSLATDDVIRARMAEGCCTMIVSVRYDPFRGFSPRWSETVSAASTLVAGASDRSVSAEYHSKLSHDGASWDVIHVRA